MSFGATLRTMSRAGDGRGVLTLGLLFTVRDDLYDARLGYRSYPPQGRVPRHNDGWRGLNDHNGTLMETTGVAPELRREVFCRPRFRMGVLTRASDTADDTVALEDADVEVSRAVI